MRRANFFAPIFSLHCAGLGGPGGAGRAGVADALGGCCDVPAVELGRGLGAAPPSPKVTGAGPGTVNDIESM